MNNSDYSDIHECARLAREYVQSEEGIRDMKERLERSRAASDYLRKAMQVDPQRFYKPITI